MVFFEHVWARKAQLEQEYEVAREWRERLERLIDREQDEPDLGTGCEPL